jgi:beta-glucan synthesis-associated protein KRE6
MEILKPITCSYVHSSTATEIVSNPSLQSYLPGQRLSACTCPGEVHPGPKRSDGSFVGRAAPEVDVFEALANGGFGQVSQSAQWAPFNVCSYV